GTALRSERAQLRHPGIHAPQRRDRPGLPPRLLLRARRDASGRGARPGHRHRRGARREISVRAGVSSSQPIAGWNGALMVVNRREFLSTLGAGAVAATARAGTAASMKFGYAAITWGANVTQAIEDIGSLGFRSIQLRSEAFAQFGAKPAALRELLDKHRLK